MLSWLFSIADATGHFFDAIDAPKLGEERKALLADRVKLSKAREFSLLDHTAVNAMLVMKYE